MNKYDIAGKQFGYWEVIERDKPHKGKQNSYWICRCQCGTVRSINRSTLMNGRSKSCGCWKGENRKGINKTHGMSKTRLYQEWSSMRRRCNSPNDKCADSYYNKGIRVCQEWDQNFTAFMEWALNNGYTDDLTIDRIDNSKGYSPDNCRWVSSAAQQTNKTNNVYIEYQGEKWCLRTLCAKIGFPYKLAHRRYTRTLKANRCITIEKLFEPIHTEKIAFRYRNHMPEG